jgi:hypothetical protein
MEDEILNYLLIQYQVWSLLCIHNSNNSEPTYKERVYRVKNLLSKMTQVFKTEYDIHLQNSSYAARSHQPMLAMAVTRGITAGFS